jgi:hypothetical protein
MFYNQLIRNMSKEGGISYMEYLRMDIRRFFLNVLNWEKENE